MTFSQQVKGEILKSVRNIKGCCATSILTAVLKASGSLSLGFRGYCFAIESENPEFLSFVEQIAKNELGVSSHISSSNVNAKGVAVYSCELEGNVGNLLGLTYRDSEGILQFNQDAYSLIPTKPCCMRAFMQGLFVACGSVVIPLGDTDFSEARSRGKYHLELRVSEDFAKALADRYDFLEFRQTSRKTHCILYLKDSEKIADFLVYVNATSSKLKLENVIIGRSIRNTANRQSNCIAHNIDKSVHASNKQIEAITHLQNIGALSSLPQALQDIAKLRVEYPEANLEELAAKLGISKSGANHRLAKLVEIAKDKQ